ncbi:unnamed protein product [Mycena citricolor]|uniref:endo-polygalacturonase n=1 Tax=Mycena citricolor TaxID=2018698 RepID=A0AAD2H009_9AGAR|nr:unnamed protein product [Mycena citricolor]
MFSTATASFLQLAALATVALAAPSNITMPRATCIVNSVASAANLKSCTSVEIQGFTVPSGQTVTIAAATGATVWMTGDIVFEKTTSAGPLITFNTPGINFNGGNRNINGNGAAYWDGQGTNGGVTKPHPFVKYALRSEFVVDGMLMRFLQIQGLRHVRVRDRAQLPRAGHLGRNHGCDSDPASHRRQLLSPCLFLYEGGWLNPRPPAAGAALGHNTDGFDISASDVTVSQCTVLNQDDCVAVNSGDAITIEESTCTGGHGISIGSIATGKSVTNFKAVGNTISGGLYGLRIKVDATAQNAQVSNVVYEGNIISGITDYGVLITQSYPANDGTPGTGGPISNVAFIGSTTTVAVNSGAMSVVIDCGACSGNCNFASLMVTSPGKGHSIVADRASITGGTY